MFFTSIIFLTILIPSLQAKPSIKLTITPDEKYYSMGNQVDIHCEILNPTENQETAQLWHVDFKTGKHTPISRSLLYNAPDDSLDVFKQNKNKRLEFVKKNYLRIRQLFLEDSGKYECNCSDCEEKLGKQEKLLLVMKTVEPRLIINPTWPLQEHAKATMKCTADDFYPYVSHKIIRHHHDITNECKNPVVPHTNIYPHKFSWEAAFTPTADWHNTSLRCTLTQGNSEQHAIKNLEVLFTPRFLRCGEMQYVDSSEETATIECSYSGNPAPQLIWLRQKDEKSITSDKGITIAIKDEPHGRYKHIVTFNREKLVALPLKTTATGNNYYQQLLNEGFIVKLMVNNEEKLSQKIDILTDVDSVALDSYYDSTCKTIQNLSIYIILFSFLIIQYIIHLH